MDYILHMEADQSGGTKMMQRIISILKMIGILVLSGIIGMPRLWHHSAAPEAETPAVMPDYSCCPSSPCRLYPLCLDPHSGKPLLHSSETYLPGIGRHDFCLALCVDPVCSSGREKPGRVNKFSMYGTIFVPYMLNSLGTISFIIVSDCEKALCISV